MKAYTILLGTGLLLAAGGPEYADACTRVVYEGTNRTVVTGRTMDWKEDPRSNLWIFPRGMERNGRKQFAEMGLQIRQRDHVGLRHLYHRRHE